MPEEKTTEGCPSPADTTKHLKYNVIYPTGNEQEYYPMLKLGKKGGIEQNELDVIISAIHRDRENKVKHVTTFYILSPPGLGKTVLGAFIARHFNCPYQIINCVSTMTDLDLLGSQVLLGSETVWQDGPLPSIVRASNDHAKTEPKAVLNGVLIINELNALTQNAQLGLNPLLDRQESVVLTQNNNELVKVSPTAHLFVIASMNPDVMGVNELQDAVRDRANALIYMDYPNEDDETRLVAKLTGLPEAAVRPFCKTIAMCRKYKTVDHQLTRAPSTRSVLDWIDYTHAWGPQTAFDLCIKNKFGTTEEERKLLESAARSQKVETFVLGIPVASSAPTPPPKPASSVGVPVASSSGASGKTVPPTAGDIYDLGDLWKAKKKK